MIALLGVLGALMLVCYVRFGLRGLEQLAQLHFHAAWVPLAAVLIQVWSMVTDQLRWYSALAAVGCFIYFAYRNRDCPGMALILVGVLLNFAAMLANHGMMPLHPEAFAQHAQMALPDGSAFTFSRNLVSSDQASTLAWLGDRFVLPGYAAKIAVWSLGDAVLILGMLILLWRTMSGAATGARTTLEHSIPR